MNSVLSQYKDGSDISVPVSDWAVSSVFFFISAFQKGMVILFWPGNFNLFFFFVAWTSISQTQQRRLSCFDPTGDWGMLGKGKVSQSPLTSDTRTHRNSRNINTASIHVSPWSSCSLQGLLVVLLSQWQFLVTVHPVRRTDFRPAVYFVAHSSPGRDWGDRVRAQGSRLRRNCLLWNWWSCWSSWLL